MPNWALKARVKDPWSVYPMRFATSQSGRSGLLLNMAEAWSKRMRETNLIGPCPA